MRFDNSTICRFVWNPSEEISVLFVPVSKFLAEWKAYVQRVWFSNLLCLTICLVCNRIFNFRRGKGSKKSHISVSNVEQSHATSLFLITGSSFTRKASKLYKYFAFQAIEKLFIHLTNLHVLRSFVNFWGYLVGLVK